jgi:pimeloyl-ACP methyl ester carboxylesterase
MKKLSTIIQIFLFSLYVSPLLGQEPIQYGSNNVQYISVFNNRIYYEEYGKGTPLLLLHGGTGSISNFQKVIPELSNYFRVVATDMPGHGRSEQADTLSYQVMANYFSEMINLMELDSVFIVGLSDGGNTALLLAHDRPDKVKRIAVSGANFNRAGYNEDGLGFIKVFSPEFVETHMQDWLHDYKEKSPQANKWEKFIHDMNVMWSQENIISKLKLSAIENRALIMLGDNDMITLNHGIEMYLAINGSEFCVLPNTPHDTFGTNPDLVNQIVINFLTKE